MALIEYGSWTPDQPRLANTCITALNVTPRARGYGPFAAPLAVTAALPAACIGRISFQRVDGVKETFAGTATKLYRRSGTAWLDVSRAIVYATATFWRFAVFGGRLIATNGIDNPQKFDLATSSLFADLPGAPIHDFPIVIRDSLIAIGVTEPGSNLDIEFSAVNDSEKWTADCGGGGQQVPDGGPLIGGTGGEIGVVIQRAGITRMVFVGGNLRYTFDKLEGALGGISAGSIVEYKGRTFYLAKEGFQLFDGVESQNISDEQVGNFFFENLDATKLNDISAAYDPVNSSVIWSYPVIGGNRLIGYNFNLKKWFESDANIRCLMTTADERLGGFDSLNQMVEFTGVPLPATLSTGDMALAQDQNTFVRAIRGLIDGNFVATIGKRNALSEQETTVIAEGPGNDRVTLRAEGRMHRFQIQPFGTWTEINGIDVEAAPTGRRA